MVAPVVRDTNAPYTPGISEVRGSTTRFLHSGLKNVDAQTTTSQTLGGTRRYDAFGNVDASTGTWSGPFGYGGGFGYQEEVTGLKLLGHRLYDSSTGRFITRDPIKDGRNWYVYCDSDPVGGVDPDGLQESEFTKNGRLWHKYIEDYYVRKWPKSFPERSFPWGRPDIIDVGRGIVVEIKPETPRKVREAQRQIIRYAKALAYDRGIIVVYPPGSKPSDFKDPIAHTKWYPAHRNVPPK